MAIADVRRLVYGLRPPALDDLGLRCALYEETLRYEQKGLQVASRAEAIVRAREAGLG